MNKKLLTITIALVLLAIIVAPVVAAPAVKRLVSPSLLLPANNAKFTYNPCILELEWKPVVDERVSGYLVEAEMYDPRYEIWYTFTSIQRITTDPWYQLDCYPGYYTYRWRVTALSSVSGCDSAPSNWRTFTFVSPATDDTRLATVRLLSPDNKAKFSFEVVQSYNWEIVPGATEYNLYHQTLNADGTWKREGPEVIFRADPILPYSTNAFTDIAGTHRWRVIALEYWGGPFSNSPWRYYTVT